MCNDAVVCRGGGVAFCSADATVDGVGCSATPTAGSAIAWRHLRGSDQQPSGRWATSRTTGLRRRCSPPAASWPRAWVLCHSTDARAGLVARCSVRTCGLGVCGVVTCALLALMPCSGCTAFGSESARRVACASSRGWTGGLPPDMGCAQVGRITSLPRRPGLRPHPRRPPAGRTSPLDVGAFRSVGRSADKRLVTCTPPSGHGQATSPPGALWVARISKRDSSPTPTTLTTTRIRDAPLAQRWITSSPTLVPR